MNVTNFTGEDKHFWRRLEDLERKSCTAACFTPFLTERELVIAQAYIKQRRSAQQALYNGGYSDAVRQVLGLFPAGRPADAAMFPIRPITLFYHRDAVLTHRDFLGACLALLLTRDSIGDILPGRGQCTIFVLASVEPVILHELKKVGSTGVRLERGVIGEIALRQEYDTIKGTVSSARLDCLIALICNASREKSALLIKGERVQLNYCVEKNITRKFFPGDVVTIQGSGKYIVDHIGGPTRKGRLPVEMRKYR